MVLWFVLLMLRDKLLGQISHQEWNFVFQLVKEFLIKRIRKTIKEFFYKLLGFSFMNCIFTSEFL